MNHSRRLGGILLFSSVFFAFAATGCASQEDESAPVEEASGAVKGMSDGALKAKLAGILNGVEFQSESDFGYTVLEGEKTSAKDLSEAIVREHLFEAVQQAHSAERDIWMMSTLADRLNIDEAIQKGGAAGASEHDKQLMIALKTMKSELRSVIGFAFGVNERGDQDDEGSVAIIYVGISKTTGKLIAIMTEAVWT